MCYDMCVQRSPNNWSNVLYDRHSETITKYLTDRVLPVLREKRGDSLVLEIVKVRSVCAAFRRECTFRRD